MENYSTARTEYGKNKFVAGSTIGLKPEVVNLLSPLSFRPKGS